MKADPAEASPELSRTQPAAIWVAPPGFGKSQQLQQLLASRPAEALVLEAGLQTDFSDSYFELLSAACTALALPAPPKQADPALQAAAWLRALNAQLGTEPEHQLWLVFDPWEPLERHERVLAFWQALLQTRPTWLRLLLATRKAPDLPLAAWVAAGAQYRDRSSLAWDLTTAQAHWQALGLSWEAQDQERFDALAGWPLGLLLAARQRQDELSETSYQQLLQQALLEWLPPFARQQPAQLWAPERQALLAAWQLQPQHWPPALAELLELQARMQPQYWLQQALQSGPARSQILLERALSLCGPEQAALRLSILTRQAHNASLSGQGETLDQLLAAGAELLEDGQSVDRAAWHYLKANRLRQCCQYPEAQAEIDALLALNARHPSVMAFQTRARILRGLTAYQAGDYALTRTAYQQALTLAESDNNSAMQLELQIMLAFLDALTGQADEPLPDDIAEQVSALPLSAQPLVWLNLAFYQLLGEHLDLKQGQAILERVRQSAAALEWQALEPLIADVEARLWRFHKDYDRARHLHRQALERLDPQTFDWLYASLNCALTLLRQQETGAARELLQTVARRAEASGSLGLWREARAALQSLDPGAIQIPDETPTRPEPLRLGTHQPRLQLKSFGHFQLQIDQQLVERWPRKRARNVLIQILLHPHGIHRETLADWLTGADDLEQALRSLDVHIHTLRKVLEPDRKGKQASHFVQFHDACYSFNWQSHYTWDAEDFGRAHQHWLRSREADPDTAEAAASQALQLYQGPFLPELDFADDWLAEREGYARKASDLALWSLDYLVRQGQYEAAEERAEQLLRWDRLSETGFGWLFQIAAQRKDRQRLERLGERMEQTYEKELGMNPPAALMQRYRELSRQL